MECLEIGILEIDGKIDSDGDIGIGIGYDGERIDRQHAIQIIDHLTKVFDINQESEFRPRTRKILSAACPGCGGLFEFFYKQDNQKCHICNDGVLVFHDSLSDATESLTYEQEKK